MKLVGPEHLSEEDKEVQRLLQEHPLLNEYVTRITLGYHALVSLCIEMMLRNETDTVDIQHSLAKKQSALYRMGIVVPGTEPITHLICSYHLIDATTIYSHTECSLDPLWQEPDWDEFLLIPRETLSDRTRCCVCDRLLSEEPPYLWNAMTYGEIYRQIRERTQQQQQQQEKGNA